MKRTLTLGTLAALAIATAAGCGTTGLAPMAGYAPQAGVINVMGVTRKLGFNYQRYEQLQKPHLHPTHLPRQAMLPSAVDNRHFCSPIADQGQLGSCTAFAMGKGLREYLMNKNGQQLVPVSALFLYYNERVVDGDVKQDAGSSAATGMGVLQKTGIAPEADWAYNIAKFAAKPPAQAFTDAAQFKIKTATQLASIDDVKTALAQGLPVTFGFKVYSSFMNIGSNGMMPVPGPDEQLEGGHEVLAVGYDDARQVIIVRNSWGTSWGDQGYFYMPYSVFGDGSTVDEMWTSQG